MLVAARVWGNLPARSAAGSPPNREESPGHDAAPPENRRGWEEKRQAGKRRGKGGGAEPAPRSTAGGGDTPRCSPMGIVALPFLLFPFSTPSPGLERREAVALQPGHRRGAGLEATPHGPFSASAETPAGGKDAGEGPPLSAPAWAGS